MQTFKCSCFRQPPTKKQLESAAEQPCNLQSQMPEYTGGKGAVSEGQLQQLGIVSLLTSSMVSSTGTERKDLQRLGLKRRNCYFINVMFHSSTRFLSTSALPCQPWAGALGAQREQKLQLCVRNILCIKTNCEEMQIQTGSLQGKLKNIDF